MFEAVLQAVRAMALEYSAPFTIDNGALPQSEALSIAPGPGAWETRDLLKGGDMSLAYVFNGKSSRLDRLIAAMDKVHMGLNSRASYSSGTGWEITDVSTIAAPAYISKEGGGQWLYGSSLNVTISVKGVV